MTLSSEKDAPLLPRTKTRGPTKIMTYIGVAAVVSSLVFFFSFPLANIEGQISKSVSSTIHRGRAGSLHLSQPRLCDANVKQYSGYFTINKKEHKKYFFWFFESRNSPSQSPTALWLSGGPGASSMFALLGENGPCTMAEGGKSTVVNPYSWTEVANMLWVDQPAGTGFSQGEFDSNEREVAWDMYVFVHTFMERFPEYNHDFYVVGESFGGHYVPSVVHRIVRENQNLRDSSLAFRSVTQARDFKKIHIDIKGMAIGNGMTNTLEQIKWGPLMAFNSSTAPSVIDEETFNKMQDALPEVEAKVNICGITNDDDLCMEAWQAYTMTQMLPVMKTKRNMYDLRLFGEYDFSAMHTYLNDPSIQQQLGVSTPWNSVNVSVWLHLAPNDFLQSYNHLVPPILKEGVRVLIYAGDQDFTCNWLGNYAWTEKLDWHGRDSFAAAPMQEWAGDESQNHPGGYIRAHQNFAFLKINGAGHLVPMDQPQHALRMFSLFVTSRL